MRELNLVTERQNFWTEAIVKEKTVRLNWLSKHDKNAYNELKIQAAENRQEIKEPKNRDLVPKTDFLDDVGGIFVVYGEF